MKNIVLTIISIVFFFVSNAQPVYEFRGVWVASVVNIDWPSSKELSNEQQKTEFINLLNMHQSNGMNTVIVQIRPAADALYPSPYEPWSEYLTGKQGVAPNPLYDPLEFMIAETHKRGMEFHAWINPYRAVFNNATSSVSSKHITKTRPHWFVTYNNQKIFNPGLPEVRDYVTKIVEDIVARYDIDALHMDDYFYPYPDKHNSEFHDKKAYTKYGDGFSKEDWRRNNCDSIIKQLHNAIRAIKPYVKFGISPFGVWRNISKDSTGSNTKAGITNYDDLYADILLWLREGWIDYVTPQLYWERGHKLCDYDILLDWWNQYTYGKHLYIGHGIYRAGTTTGWKNKHELPEQIQKLREYTTTQGSIYFSSKSFEKNPNGWSDSLKNNYYAYPALPPPMPWIDSIMPPQPIVEKANKYAFFVTAKNTENIKGFAVFTLNNNDEPYLENARLEQLIVIGDDNKIEIQQWIKNKRKVFVSTVSRGNNISEWIELK
ncbi:MAG: family 10 glycosylhydrolase [Chitinophagaceae bacterium]|nr:family 10 glycosylhydrolase [Chitinophagaceae bacterium]MCW5904438.1 family 10 glycosylhydrolase [Chitinophagaceae bacterium]